MEEQLLFIKTMNKYIGAICQNNGESEKEREQAIIDFASEAIQQVKDYDLLHNVSKRSELLACKCETPDVLRIMPNKCFKCKGLIKDSL